MSVADISFRPQRALFEHYLGEVFESLGDAQQGLLLEARTRLEQLDYALACCRNAGERQAEIWRSERQSWDRRHPLAADPTSDHQPNQQQRTLWLAAFAARYHAEAFYYFAARLQRILKNAKGTLPGLDFRPVPGIVKVRNDLIEHPEGRNSRIFAGGTQVTADPFNLWLKVPGTVSAMNGPLDPGLIENVEALRKEIDRSLTAALSAEGSSP